jgi:riboflavin kinase/FMN adenylyltransferase
MIRGRVVKGLREARGLGYPTANLSIPPAKTKLKTGVYAAWTTHDEKKYPSALVIQTKPPKVEVHLIGYKGKEFYGKTISIDPVQKVSEIESMPVKELIAKIDRDVEAAMKILFPEA